MSACGVGKSQVWAQESVRRRRIAEVAAIDYHCPARSER